MFASITNRLLIAGLAILATGNAFALTASDGAPELSLYIPGSQSNDPAFGFLVNNTTVANALCLDNANAAGTGTTHIYFHTTAAANPPVNDNYSAIYCYTDATKIPGLTGGIGSTHKTRLWISRRRLGASFVGLDAVANGTLLTYLKDPATANCSAVNGSYSSGGSTFQYNYSCLTATAGIKATAATSDITPDVFHGTDNITPGFSQIDASLIDNKYAIAGHIIGTPVTLKFRNALQYAQVQNGSLPSSCAVGDETASCTPSLSKEQLVSIFSGTLANWSNLKVKVAGVDYTLPQIVASGVSAGVSGLSNPLDTKVHICRRENGAGQQVAFLANIMQYPCLGNSAPTLTEPGIVPNDVQYATSLGAVDKCLGDFNDGTNGWFGTSNPNPYPNPPATTVTHGNQWAISIQTTERNANNSAHYRFIKINGALPTGEQAYLGHYPLVGETGISWITNPNDNINNALNALVSYSQDPSTIKSRNTGLGVHSFGQAGYVALSSNGFAPSPTWNANNPVTPYTHAANGAVDACSVPVVNADFGVSELR